MPAGNQQHESTPGAPGQAATSSAGLMALIADVERQLLSLREADERRRIAEESLAAREQAAAESERRAQDAAQQSEALSGRLRAERASLDEEAERLRRERDQIESARREIESQRADLEKELERIAALERAANEARASAESVRQGAEAQSARADQLVRDAEQRRSQMERTLAERGAAFRAAEERMEQRASDASAMIAEAQATAEGLTARIKSLESELHSARAEATRLAADLQDKSQVIASRNEELKSLRAQAASLRDKSAGDGALKKQLAEIQEANARSMAEAESLRGALAQNTSKAEEYLRHIAEVEGQLAEAQAACRAAQQAATQQSAAQQAGRGADEATQRRLKDLESARDEAVAEAAKLREFARTLGQELAAARAGGGDAGGGTHEHDDERVSARRERLRRQRALLRGQSEKVKRAGDAVRERFEQVEQILSQRAELVAAKKLVEDARRKVRARQARSGALAAIFYATIAMVIYAGIGWVVAQNVAPAVYAVSAEVQADASGRPLSAAELDEWQRYHEDLIADPRFMEVASEKLKQRGIASLATPTALKDRLGADSTLITDTPGKLTIELRGLGAERTKRELDTIVTTFVRTANAARERRVDGSNTIIASEATATGAPLHDERIFYAAGIAGALTLLSSLAAFVLWRKLYEAKASIERTDEFDGLLDERRWQMPSRPS